MLLMLDEVFDLRHKNQWLRRRIVAILRQLIKATFGDMINRWDQYGFWRMFGDMMSGWDQYGLNAVFGIWSTNEISMTLEDCVWGHDQQVRSVWLLRTVFGDMTSRWDQYDSWGLCLGTWSTGEISMTLEDCVWGHDQQERSVWLLRTVFGDMTNRWDQYDSWGLCLGTWPRAVCVPVLWSLACWCLIQLALFWSEMEGSPESLCRINKQGS